MRAGLCPSLSQSVQTNNPDIEEQPRMSKYLTQYELQGSAQLQRRVAACAASLGVKDPDGFAYDHRWRLAVTPGWVELYDAEAAQMPEPETEYTAEDYPDPSWVIPDEQILDVVQAILAEQAAAAGSSTAAPGDSLAPGIRSFRSTAGVPNCVPSTHDCMPSSLWADRHSVRTVWR